MVVGCPRVRDRAQCNTARVQPAPGPSEATAFGAVILAGGAGARLGGVDKASLEYAGQRLLDHALAAVAGAHDVVVVGDPLPTHVPVRFVREVPAYGGPAAALLTGRDALRSTPAQLVVLAVDMPRVTTATVRRLREAAQGHDGAFLVDASGRRQVAGVLEVVRFDAVRVTRATADPSGLALHHLLADLDLVEVPALGREGRDVDTWDDLADPTP